MKLKIYFLNKYKMFKISAETAVEDYVYNIIDKQKRFRLRNKEIAEKLGAPNIYDWLVKNKKLGNIKNMDQN